ncbi:MAG: type II toxin-antitoxin system RelE/ParE family toxin [Oscillospiraceae bacterium]|nr:type II toxin-antitoxin system RelE/ParE family toxin [Oscillospiraceae bacterium]
MNYRIHVTKKASKDVVEAADYIEFNLRNPTAADKLVDDFERKISTLSEFPDRNRIVDDPILKSWGIRFAMVNNYLAFYIIVDDIVHVVRFLYSRRNWAYILKQGINLE